MRPWLTRTGLAWDLRILGSRRPGLQRMGGRSRSRAQDALVLRSLVARGPGSQVTEVRVPGVGVRSGAPAAGCGHSPPGQVHEQHGGHRALGLAVALSRPVQGEAFRPAGGPAACVPEDPIRASPPGIPPAPSGKPCPGLALRGLAGSSEMQRHKPRVGTRPKHLGLLGVRSLGIPTLVPAPWGLILETSHAEGTGGAGPGRWFPSTVGLRGLSQFLHVGKKVEVKAQRVKG